MKKILKILFAIMAPVWFAFSCAHAEEVEVVPDDLWTYQSHFVNSVSDITVLSDHMVNAPSSYRNPSSSSQLFSMGDFLIGDSNISVKNGFQSSDFPWAGLYYPQAFDYYWGHYNTSNTPYDFPSFSLTFSNSEISLDVSNLIPGYYRYECEIYLGISVICVGQYSLAPSLEPTFTFNSSPYYLTEFGFIQYMGTEDLSIGTSYTNQLFGTKLVHLHFEDTWEVNPDVGEYTWNISPAFQYLISSLNYSGFSLTKNHALGILSNNRFKSVLYSNVIPPVTPTPTPTPSPNQDIINNDNTNTTNIITTINDGFDALSAAFEGSIYGLTDLIFGSASDWIDFFSDVQDDMEEYLPVVTFFQSCKNILANFFNVESTDPTALQYIAGWQSDIYTLHIGALPLVLPEGTFNFFPEVNFNLNNPFMNEIRPYWLTFSNVLITLLFLRYLANYLFRWTQLLTGDTSVAFQLFHHAPDELENLGTDPYDLAGDYSYDSIDSANHDLYQDAEAHYGHGAARYLSKVFHSK